jgi:thiol-disulfide isomerase/thioredoxin
LAVALNGPKQMRFSKAIPIALCILIVSFAAPAQKPKSRAAKPRKPTAVVAPIDTEALKGLITQPRQRPLLVNFWATFCDPCRAEFPDLVKIDKEYRPHALEFVTVSLDDMSDIKTSVPEFLDSMKATMPAYLLNASDPEPAINLVDRRWRGDLPATFLYNEKGEVVYKHIGRVNPAELREAIEKAVKKSEDKLKSGG